MRILYFDCFSGISGDMTLGALIDSGVDAEVFKSELNKLDIDGYRLEIKKGIKNGITGTYVNVILDEHDHEHEHEHEHEHDHAHTHNNDNKVTNSHNHNNDSNNTHTHSEYYHRNLMDIELIIDKSRLSDKVKEHSKLMFRNVAGAEAKIHGKNIEDVHFHEVGAVDSIVDIVGTAICVEILKIDEFISSPVNTGMGFVKCQHGVIPVPGPAALELLKGVPIYSKDINTELVTPTGAAIISTLCNSFGPIPHMTVEKIGYGCGKKELEIPNLLRIIIGDTKKIISNSKKDDVLYMMECNIDDMNCEFYDHTMNRLFNEGALDVFLTNIIMKKGRPAVKLSVLAKPDDIDKLSNIVFKETSTIGIRKYQVSREALERKIIEVDTKYGAVHVKASYLDGKIVNYAPEYETVRNLAVQTGESIKNIYNETIKSI